MAPERIEREILMVRHQKVILDAMLAELYGVPTKVLLQAVKRNMDRFPADFCFELSQEETDILRSFEADVAGKRSAWGGRRSPPFAFTEQGVAMLSSVLRSPRAVKVNIEIMRAFVRLRQLLSTHADLARRLDELEAKYDEQFRVVFDAIRALMSDVADGEEETPRPRIGFKTADGDDAHGRRHGRRPRRLSGKRDTPSRLGGRLPVASRGR